MINSAGNYGWPYCRGNGQAYRAKLPAATGGGGAAPAGHLGTVAGSDAAAGAGGGGFWDCDDPQGIENDSPFNTGLERIPAARPTNLWYGPQGGCYDFPRNANSVPIYTGSNTSAEPASYRRCPWLLGGSQAPMTAGTYRKPAGDKPDAWPAYWDGRWFLADYAGGVNLRHALLMDPATQFTGGLPVAADSLFGIIPTSLMNNNRIIDMDFGADGALYIADYCGSNFTIVNNANSVWRFAYIGGPDTPGPDPQVTAEREPGSDDVRVQHRQVRRRLLQVGLLRRRQRHRRERLAHVPDGGQRHQADSHADGHLRGRHDVLEDDRRPGPDDRARPGHARRAEDARPDVRLGRDVRRLRPGRGQHLRGQRHGQRHLDAAATRR